jgi:hypothetical protein
MEKSPLMVHKIHWLRAHTEPEVFRTTFMSLLSERKDHQFSQDDTTQVAMETYPYDNPAFARLKYLINFQLPNQVVDEIAGDMFLQNGVDDEVFCRAFYMGRNDVRELAENGHVIGNHGHSHIPFSRLDRESMVKEIKESKSFFEELTGKQQEWVSYPHGRQWALPEDLEAFCRGHHFTMGLCLGGGWNRQPVSRYCLNRVNENELDTVT